MLDPANYQRTEEEKLDKEIFDKTAAVLAKGAINLVPGGGTAYELNELRNEYRQKRNKILENERMMEFHQRLVSNSITEEDILKHPNSSEILKDYYSILDLVVSEDEREKIEYYSKLFKELFRKKYHPDFKKQIIKTFKELTRSDFDTLFQIYDLNKEAKKEKENLKTGPVIKAYERAESKLYRLFENSGKDTLLNISIQNMKKLGILQQDSGEPHPKSTNLLEQIGEIIS